MGGGEARSMSLIPTGQVCQDCHTESQRALEPCDIDLPMFWCKVK